MPRLVGVPGTALNFIFTGPQASPLLLCEIAIVPTTDFEFTTVPWITAVVTVPWDGRAPASS